MKIYADELSAAILAGSRSNFLIRVEARGQVAAIIAGGMDSKLRTFVSLVEETDPVEISVDAHMLARIIERCPPDAQNNAATPARRDRIVLENTISTRRF